MATLADLSIQYCRSCQKPIYWLRNDTTGKVGPIDARETSEGPIIIRADGGNLLYHVLTKDDLAGGLGDGISRYSNHFQTCPNAASHKKAGG